MNKPLAKVTRENHLNHIISVLPLITVVYFIQCFVMMQITPEKSLGNFPIIMAISLISFISALFYYDKNSHIIFYNDHLLIYFKPINKHKKINYNTITEIHVPEEKCSFASIIIKTTNGQQTLHFIDHPHTIKELLLKLKKDSSSKENSINKNAA